MESVQQNRKKQSEKSQANIRRILKLINNASHSTITKRAKTVAKKTLDSFNNISKQHYNSTDQPILELLQFSVENYKIKVNVEDEDMTIKKQKNEAIVRVIDKKQISRDAYRDLASIENDLSRKWAISDQ